MSFIKTHAFKFVVVVSWLLLAYIGFNWLTNTIAVWHYNEFTKPFLR